MSRVVNHRHSVHPHCPLVGAVGNATGDKKYGFIYIQDVSGGKFSGGYQVYSSGLHSSS